MKIPNHIQLALHGCNSEHFGISWEHFGEVWTWATEREWWVDFLEAHSSGGIYCISVKHINPSNFADAITTFPKEKKVNDAMDRVKADQKAIEQLGAESIRRP